METSDETITEPQSLGGALRRWFLAPPRPHGHVLEDRTVSFLELFYDLVFVVLIAQVAHTLAGDVSWIGFRNFTIVFALIWIAWLNGSLYHELHGYEDGRGRSYIFAQMTLLVVLAGYAAHAADSAADGRGFAIVYAILMSLITLQWWNLRKYDTPEMAAIVLRYVAGFAVTIAIIVASIFVDSPDTRLALWAGAASLTVITTIIQIFRRVDEDDDAFYVTESMAERFGLFTIIVLGEVVVGVADGLADVDRTTKIVITAVFALTVGFGIWWNYFDFIGRRQPRSSAASRGLWNFGHFPLWLSIAATGAGMVSLIEHAADGRTPASTAWLIAGGTAGVTLSLAALAYTMKPHPGRAMVPMMLLGASVAALLLGALRPSPLILAAGLNLILSAVWMESFLRHARAGTSIQDL